MAFAFGAGALHLQPAIYLDLEVTPGYLSRIFKKVMQCSFSDYIAEVKIEEAKKLLLQDNNRVYEVSALLGCLRE